MWIRVDRVLFCGFLDSTLLMKQPFDLDIVPLFMESRPLSDLSLVEGRYPATHPSLLGVPLQGALARIHRDEGHTLASQGCHFMAKMLRRHSKLYLCCRREEARWPQMAVKGHSCPSSVRGPTAEARRGHG